MKTKMFTVRDSKSEAFLPPLYFRQRGEALRAFQVSANEPSHNFCRFPEDFSMYEIGEWNDETGRVEMYDTPVLLGIAIDFKSVQSNLVSIKE